MDKFRKIGLWLWQNKERLVLGLLVVVLSYRVYKVVSEQPEPPKLPDRPAGSDFQAPELPKAPPQPVPENYSSLHSRNPFWYYSNPPTGGDSQAGATEEEEIHLLGIQALPRGRGYTAQIRTKAAKWYREGEEFESFKVLKIDPKSQEVEVYSGKSGNTITLRMQ